MSSEHDELSEIIEEIKQLDDQMILLMGRKQTLLKRKKKLEKVSNPAPAVDLQSWKKNDFPWSAELDKLKKSLFKVEEFRPLQLQSINATLSGQDCIVIMPTGGGKSLCFQLPAFLSKGFTLVVSPLVSLMEDQLMSLAHLGIKSASLLNASSSTDQVKLIQDSMTSPTSSMRLLYVTPEKLAKSKRFMSRLEKAHSLGRLSRLVIDEVHCCSQWGHDFRPDYKFLGVMKRQFPKVPILGLTATATQDVIDDVVKMLAIPNALVFRAPLNRPNLFYEVHPKSSNAADAVNEIYTMISTRFANQSGIVYCLAQRDTEDVARELCKRGLRASCYHANMDTNSRSSVHAQWSKNQLQVVVATIAFGMGIDKSDVRFVIHHSISKSMESYYQESGRAGRDDGRSCCILYVNFSDIFRQSTMVFTEQTGLEKLYAIAGYAFDLMSCRRQLIARHFSESWTTTECQRMCDHCEENDKGCIKKHDIADYARDIVALLKHSKQREQRMTGLKLLEAWLGKGSPALRLADHLAPKTMSRAEAERVVVHLLLNGYLREDFHFTPYSTISYLVPGERVHSLSSDQHNIYVHLRMSPSSDSDLKQSGSSSALRGCKQKTSAVAGKQTNSSKRQNDTCADAISKAKKKRTKYIDSSEDEDNQTAHCSSELDQSESEPNNFHCKIEPVVVSDDDTLD